MTRNEMNLYRWADAEEMRPRPARDDTQQAQAKMMQKLAELLLDDVQL